MKTYIKFIISIFLKSFFFVFSITLTLVLILNLLSELEFFKEIKVGTFFPLYLSLLNSPALIFEMFPFIFLISTQLFFINLFNNNEIYIFKYSGLKNISFFKIISLMSFILGIIIITLFYNLSSNLKNFYISLKSNYTADEKHLAVITKNGLWIKDVNKNRSMIVNSSEIDENYLINNFITEFDENYKVIRNIKSPKIDISNKEWILFDAEIYEKNAHSKSKIYKLNSNFDYKRIKNLFSNLSSLSILELIKLKNNYKQLNYSTTEVDIQLHKLISYPLFLMLMSILSGIIMFNTRNSKSTTLKISIGLFFSVIIYYIVNFFNVLGNTEKISLFSSVWIPLFILGIANTYLIYGVNEK